MSRPILRTTQTLEPDGTEVTEEEWLLGPQWSTVTPMPHPHGDTRYEVIEGQARVRIGATGRVYRAGESVLVAAGQSHGLDAVDDRDVRLLVQRWSHSASPSRTTQRIHP